MSKLARKEILKIKPYIPGKPIEEVKRELGLKDVIKLASNENAYPPSPKVIRAARRALFSVNRYPDGGCFYLKRALASRFRLKPENIIIGNGSDEIIFLASRAFLKPDDEVIIAKPTFLMYEIASQFVSCKIKFVPLREFHYDIKEMTRLMTQKTKFVFIANPDNPTGTYVTSREIEYLVSCAPKNTILFFDEAYFEFAKDIKDFPHTLKYLNKKNVIITRSFSKAYSLAGLRVGYGFSNEDLIDCMNRVREPFNVNSIAQAAAITALRDDKYKELTLKRIKEEKAFLYTELEKLGLKYAPSVTNFILISIGEKAEHVYRKLLKRGIIVREMSAWSLKNFIRVTVGRPFENRAFLAALSEILKKKRRS